MRALLDINVLIALLDLDHVFHERAQKWWAAHSKFGWASCPLTENGFVRIMSNPTYSKSARFSPIRSHSTLRDSADQTNHAFWPDDLSLRDRAVFDESRLLSPKLITDHYLLALAVKHQGRLATFDQSIPLTPVLHAKPVSLCVV